MPKTLISPFDANYFIGYVNYVSPRFSRIHFPSSTLLKKFHFAGEELNASLVGNYVAIEGDNYGYLGKIVEISLPEKERLDLNEKAFQNSELHPTGKVEILLSFNFRNQKIRSGLDQFPSVGAKVFACSSKVIVEFFRNFGVKGLSSGTLFNFATLSTDLNTAIGISPQALFGRHCAIVGSTGGGKSFTVAKLIEETIRNNGKSILIDATGEYETLTKDKANVSSISFNKDAFFHFSKLSITDLFMLFRPSEQIQLPKLQEAIKSLKLVKILQAKSPETLTEQESTVKGYIDSNNLLVKADKSRMKLLASIKVNPQSENLDGDFDISSLAHQIHKECVWNTPMTGGNQSDFGGYNEKDFGMCQSLITRIFLVTKTNHFESIFGLTKNSSDPGEFSLAIRDFLASSKKVLRISLSDVPFEGNIREILVNAIGRHLLDLARQKKFLDPTGQRLVIFVDEAHQFLNKRIKGEFSFDVELGAFDEIAKECRKYGLFLVLSTQMPRDIPQGTLSQVGTFIVHRLINRQDKEAIENACSSSSQYSLSFIPVLGEGEALLMGVDFPMPVVIKVGLPRLEPKYGTPLIFSKDLD